MKKKDLDRPRKVRTQLDELEVLARLKDSVEWAVVKRIAIRYIGNLRRASFKLSELDPNYLVVRHTEFVSQALGIKNLIKMIDNSGKKLEKEK